MPDASKTCAGPSRGAADERSPLLVCGAGAAGMAAAVAAARLGVRVYLVEAADDVGGTVASALIHTLAGLYNSGGELLQHGLGAELEERLVRKDSAVRRRRMGRVWVLHVCPNVYRQVVRDWVAGEGNITLLVRSRVSTAVCTAGAVTGVEITTDDGTLSLRPGSVVDATGTGEVVGRIDPGLLQDDRRRSAAGMIFRMRGVAEGSLDFPRGALLVQELRRAAAEGLLPRACDKAWIDRGIHADEAFIKLFVPLPDDWRDRRGEIMREARGAQESVAAFLMHLPQFAGATVVQCGELGIRDGGRVQGEYCLSVDDVRQMRKFDDAACRGCWPIEYWDCERGVALEYLREGDYYEIPLRSLRVRGLGNVWAAGKCLSADPLAHASARVAGTCWAMGEAAGKAAVQPERAETMTRGIMHEH